MRPLATPRLAALGAALLVAGCASPALVEAPAPPTSGPMMSTTAPSPDPRVGLGDGLFDAEQALWNLDLVSETAPPEAFVGVTNSDLAFTGPYAIQGNYNGIQVWDLTDPAAPELVTEYVCPASQSDVSVYGDLMFVSGEGLGGRLDCGTQGVDQAVSPDRLRGIRIFDISNIREPEYIANVQTCRGSHTHSVLKDPDDDENVYVYVSGSAGVRPAEELPNCVSASPTEDPNSALFRIEVIRVPLDNPRAAAIVSSPRIFEGLTAPETHGMAPDDVAAMDRARAEGKFIATFGGQERVLPDPFAQMFLGQIVMERGGEGAPTAADSMALRQRLPALLAERFGAPDPDDDGPRPGPTQCHDITLYPAIGLAGGACEGYGLLLDIRDPVNPTRLEAVADSNFSYWHSATFNNDGTKVLFTDEWGGGGQPKCRASDPMEWGANAIFTIEDGHDLDFQSYYKIPAAQTTTENCVAHNGSLIPIPGRDVMVQSWYQGGISVFDWTDPANPVEIAYFDRGPIDADEFQMGGSWSVYWYNGLIVSSEIARGLDVLKLEPSGFLSANEIAAAETVRFDELNAQGQPKYDWPPSFALAGAYADQLERSRGLAPVELALVRTALQTAEAGSGTARRATLMELATGLSGMAGDSPDAAKVTMLAEAVRALAMAG
ncbi:LVIVD repeat-containing protein [Rubrivirga sp.]|uniref:LVIVD repeat-containing protein n=1 Tax=Rubrivirga sp. TaxID=1885344 RepID=UPI003B519F3B